MKILNLLGLLLALTITINGQNSIDVTILGVHHFHNPGADMFNILQDNIKAPERQKEVKELVQKLIQFRPTKVLIEKPYGDTIYPARYAHFLSNLDESKLNENEAEQVAFRIAAALDHATIYPFNYRQSMDLEELQELAAADSIVGQKFQDLFNEIGTFITGINQELQRSSMLEFLSLMNQQEGVDLNHQTYLRMLQMTGEKSYGASKGVSDWYGRNIHMFYNLNRIVDFNSQEERILIIVGQGHKAILQDLIEDAPYYNYVDILEFLR